MCFQMYIDVCAHACLYVHFCNIPPQVLKLASLASPPPPLLFSCPLGSWILLWKKICTLLFQFFGAFFASKG